MKSTPSDFQHLRFDKVADAALGHDGNRDRVHDLQDQFRIAHARHAALRANVRRDALQRHDGARARLFRDLGVLGRDHVHDDAALEHLRQAALDDDTSYIFLHVTLHFSR